MPQPKDTDWLNGVQDIHTYIHTHTHTVYNGPILDLGHIQTESEGMEKGIPCKYKLKESWSSNTPIRQNRL